MRTKVRNASRKTLALALVWALAAPPARAGLNIDLNASSNNYAVAWNGSATSGLLRACQSGDLNGDGVDDIVMIEQGADTQSRTNNGAAYIVYGVQRSTGGLVRQVASDFNVRIDGGSSSDALYYCYVWDINNDNQDDLILATSNLTIWYALYGPFPSGTGNVKDLGTASNYNVRFTAPGAASAFYLYRGEVNNDGIEDVIIESPWADVTATNSGSLYIMYGPMPAGTANTRDVGNATDYNLRINGPASNDSWLSGQHYDGYNFNGKPAFALGDLNGDGATDLAIGAPRADSWGNTDNGSVWVTTGPFPSGTGNSWNVSSPGRFMARFDGNFQNSSGMSRSLIADLNGDGYNDLCMVSSHSDNNGGDSGLVFCVSGPINYAIDTVLAAFYNKVFIGAGGSWYLGYYGMDAVDLNNDGIKDLVIYGAHSDYPTTDAGLLYVVYGGPTNFNITGSSTVYMSNASAYNVRIAFNDQGYHGFSHMPPFYKDMNGDGVTDLVATSRGYSSDWGYGQESCDGSGFSGVGIFFGPLPAGPGVDRRVDTNHDLYYRYSNCKYFGPFFGDNSGDFDGDGVPDLAIGYPYFDAPAGANSGRVYFVSVGTSAARVTSPNLFTNSLTPTVTWSAVSGASAYRLQVASDPQFNTIAYENASVSGLSQATSALSNGGSYYARVKANNGNHQHWGPIVSFTVDTTAPTAPVLSTPGDATDNHPTVGTQTPLFDWSDASTE